MAETANNSGSNGEKENQVPAAKAGSGALAKMFLEGTKDICTHRSTDLFQQLDKRSLTDDEQAVINKRVELQRQMFALFEKQEKARKVAHIQEVHADLNEEEAAKALEICENNEEDAVGQLLDASFKRRVQASCGSLAAAAIFQPGRSSWAARPSGRRPKKVDASQLGGGVFVGSFRGRGFAKPAAAATPFQPVNDAAAVAASEHKAEGEQGEAQEGNDEERGAHEAADGVAEDAANNSCSQEGSPEKADPVASSASASSPPATEPQQYALVRQLSDGSIRALTNSETKRIHGGSKTLPQNPTVSDTLPADPAPLSPAGSPAADAPPSPAAAAAVRTDATSAATARAVQSAANVVRRLDEAMAVKFLAQMDADKRAAVLGLLKETDADQASTFSSALEQAQQQAQAASPAAAAPDADNMAAAAGIKTAAAKAAKGKKAAAGSKAPKCTAKKPGAQKVKAAAPHAAAEHSVAATDAAMDPGQPAIAEPAEQNAVTGSEAAPDDDFAAPPRHQVKGKRQAKTPAAVKLPKRPKATKASATPAFAAPEGSAPSDDAADARGPTAPALDGFETGPSADNNHSPANATTVASEQRSKAAAGAAEAGTADAAAEAGLPAGCEADAEAGAGAEVAASGSSAKKGSAKKGKAGSAMRGGGSRGGVTHRGRVKQRGGKRAELITLGTLRTEKGWCDGGCIFPEGYTCRVNFRSSVQLDALCVHECSIVRGKHWPAPTFRVAAMDRPAEALDAKSCTGCWTGVLGRINAEIEARRAAGEDLPPPPKTAIAGPEYFGMNQPEIVEAIEALDPEHRCEAYWHGKEARAARLAGLPPPTRSSRPALGEGAGAHRARAKRSRYTEDDDGEDGGGGDDNEDETAYLSNRWSAVSRTERYNKRCRADGEEGPQRPDSSNPLPELIDPITLEAVVTPAISPYGHVMGMATWKAVLAEQGVCPFTKQALSWEQCTVLTHSNIERYRDRMIL